VPGSAAPAGRGGQGHHGGVAASEGLAGLTALAGLAGLTRWAGTAQVDPDAARPGVLGLVVVLALVVATVLLLRSFTKHLRRVDFDEGDPPDPGDPVAPPDDRPS